MFAWRRIEPTYLTIFENSALFLSENANWVAGRGVVE